MKRITLILVVMVLLVSGAPVFAGGAGEEDVYEATFAHVVSADIAKGRAATMFAELVEERSDGRIRIEVFPDSQLGNDREITEQMQLGDIEFNAPFTGVLPAFVEQTQLFDLPFAFPDNETIFSAMHGDLGEIMDEYLQDEGLRTLGFWAGGFKQITHRNAIRSPSDIAGSRIRVSQSPLLISQFEALGANAIDIPFAELYTALQQGTVDGQENSLANIYTRQFFEVQDYMTLSNHGYLGYVFLVSDDWYQSLPDDLQQIVDEVATEVNEWQWEQAIAEDEEYLSQLRGTSMEIIELSDSERQEFVDATASVYDVFANTVSGGSELLQALYSVRGFE